MYGANTQQTNNNKTKKKRQGVCISKVAHSARGTNRGESREAQMKTKLRGGERSEGKVKRQGDEGGREGGWWMGGGGSTSRRECDV